MIGLPSPGEGRFWTIEHQPRKKTAPLRIELREKAIPSAKAATKSLSRLISYEDTVADEKLIIESAEKILARAARVDQFVGIYEGNG